MTERSNLRIPTAGALAGDRISVVGFGMTLDRSVAPGRHLRARCRSCGETAPVEPGYWLSRGYGKKPLTALEGRLRCVCRSLDVGFEVALGAPHDPPRFYVMP